MVPATYPPTPSYPANPADPAKEQRCQALYCSDAMRCGKELMTTGNLAALDAGLNDKGDMGPMFSCMDLLDNRFYPYYYWEDIVSFKNDTYCMIDTADPCVEFGCVMSCHRAIFGEAVSGGGRPWAFIERPSAPPGGLYPPPLPSYPSIYPPTYPSDSPPSFPSDSPPSYPSDSPPTYPSSPTDNSKDERCQALYCNDAIRCGKELMTTGDLAALDGGLTDNGAGGVMYSCQDLLDDRFYPHFYWEDVIGYKNDTYCVIDTGDPCVEFGCLISCHRAVAGEAVSGGRPSAFLRRPKAPPSPPLAPPPPQPKQEDLRCEEQYCHDAVRCGQEQLTIGNTDHLDGALVDQGDGGLMNSCQDLLDNRFYPYYYWEDVIAYKNDTYCVIDTGDPCVRYGCTVSCHVAVHGVPRSGNRTSPPGELSGEVLGHRRALRGGGHGRK